MPEWFKDNVVFTFLSSALETYKIKVAQPVAKFISPVTQPIQRLNYKIFGPIIDKWAKYTAVNPIKGAIGL
nr:hypothetical protein [Saprospiraceae bacterium]